MKKFLSLVLALVMTMSLVTISAGATDFADDEAITYDEAVAVISAVKVVDGYTDGSFKPTATLTRGAAAKIICNMILGPTTAAELPTSVAPFSDVPANSTFAGYIAYCAKEGIIGGYADGTFKPGNTLTGYAFMKMLLGALGYDADIEGYNTPGTWSISVAKQALGIGLNAGLKDDFNGIKPVTREEACLYALNTLKADMVEYDSKTSVTVGGAEVVIAGSKAKEVKTNALGLATADEHIAADGVVQFAEKYFSKLTLSKDIDAFARPTNDWVYNKKDVGSFVDYTLLVEQYTTGVSGKDVYETLGKNVVDTYDVYVFVDGNSAEDILPEINKNNKKDLTDTDKGVLTQVYVDKDEEIAIVTMINTYLAIANSDYNEKKDSLSLTVYHIDKVNGDYVKAAGTEAMTVLGEDFPIVVGAEKDDVFMVSVAEGEVQLLGVPEVVEDVTLTAFSKDSSVSVGSDKYEYGATIEYKDDVLNAYDAGELKERTYNLYVDEYGYLLGVDLVTSTDNYVFITGIDKNGSNLSTKYAEAFGIFTDGSTENLKFDVIKSLQADGTTALVDLESPIVNTWCKYTVNKDGIYTLTEIAEAMATGVKVAQYQGDNATAQKIDTKHVSLPASGTFTKVYGNDDTVYLTAKLTKMNNGTNNYIVISGVDNVTTGVKNTSLTTYTDANVQNLKDAWNGVGNAFTASGMYTLYKSNGYVVATVVVGKDDAVAKNVVYVSSKTGAAGVSQESYADGQWTWTRKVIKNGEEIELTEVGDSLTYLDTMTKGSLVTVSLNADGNVIGLSAPVPAVKTTINAAVNAIEADIDDTVFYQQAWADQAKVPQLKGSTLYVSTSDNQGFFVSENVNIVLVQTNKNKETTTYETGVKNLEGVLSEMNADTNGYYDYTITAIIEDGAATSIIVVDANTDGYTAPTVPTVSGKDVRVDLRTPGTVKVYTTKAAANFTADEAANAISAQLLADGYTISAANFDGTNYIFTAKKPGDAFSTTFTFTPTVGTNLMYNCETVTLNGSAVIFTEDCTITALLADQGLEFAGKTYVKFYKKAANTTTFVQTTDGSVLATGDVLTTNYLNVRVNGAPNISTSITNKLIDVSNLEQASTATGNDKPFYALATDTLRKGVNATGTGVQVGASGYLPYGSTFKTIDANDGNVNHVANIAAFNKVKLTVVDDTVGSTSTTVTAQAYTTSAANISGLSGIGAAGTMMSVDGADFVADSTTVTLNKDVTVKVGYVKVGTHTVSALTGMTVDWSVATNAVVKVGSDITATVNLPAAGIDPASTCEIDSGDASATVNTAGIVVEGTGSLTTTGGKLSAPSTMTKLTGKVVFIYTVGTTDPAYTLGYTNT